MMKAPIAISQVGWKAVDYIPSMLITTFSSLMSSVGIVNVLIRVWMTRRKTAQSRKGRIQQNRKQNAEKDGKKERKKEEEKENIE